jgi:hypothetical protein
LLLLPRACALSVTPGNRGRSSTANRGGLGAGIYGLSDFDTAMLDPATGELEAEFQPNSTTGEPGDKLHPNRTGYAATGRAAGLGLVFGATGHEKWFQQAVPRKPWLGSLWKARKSAYRNAAARVGRACR